MATLIGYRTIARDLLGVFTGLSTTGRVYLTEHCWCDNGGYGGNSGLLNGKNLSFWEEWASLPPD